MGAKNKVSCYECENTIIDDVITAKDTTALNKKILGRNLNGMFCARCLADYIGVEKCELSELVEKFKEQGCELF